MISNYPLYLCEIYYKIPRKCHVKYRGKTDRFVETKERLLHMKMGIYVCVLGNVMQNNKEKIHQFIINMNVDNVFENVM